EYDPVALDAVERELLADRAADLRRARGDEVDEGGALLAARARLQRADERDDTGLVDLVASALERHPHHLAQALEVALEIRLVEVPAVHDRCRRGPARRPPRRQRPAHTAPRPAREYCAPPRRHRTA